MILKVYSVRYGLGSAVALISPGDYRNYVAGTCTSTVCDDYSKQHEYTLKCDRVTNCL